MTIKVEEKEDGSFEISWDKNDPQESILNDYTEQDFINLIAEYLDKLKEDDGKGQDIL